MSDRLTDWIGQELKRLDWPYSELARQAGVSRTLISRTLSGDMPPSADFCIKVAAALNASPIYLLQLAGILPEDVEIPTSVNDSTIQELVDLARNLTQDQREELVRFAHFLRRGG